MFKKTVLVLCVYLLPFVVIAQTTEVSRVLQEIQQNNQELKAYASLVESRQLALKSQNNLPDPQAGAYYLPWGDHDTGDYTEFQISQSLEFPTVYGVRNKLIDKQQEQLALEYAIKRQEVLLTAQKYILEVIYLNSRLTVEQLRMQQAKKVFDQVQELFEKEQVGILEVNKAKISWLQDQFRVQQLEQERLNLLLLLQNLNGGQQVAIQGTDYESVPDLALLDSLWQEKLLTDPYLKELKQEEEVAFQQIRLTKNQSLPNLTAGFNQQGVRGSYYSGIYAGASIPLWSNRHKVKAAQASYQYHQAYTNARILASRAVFEKQYQEYQLLLSKFREYQRTLSSLNSDALLLQAYELGEISFMEFYTELQFYRQAYDAMLEMEKQLNQLKAELLKHQL